MTRISISKALILASVTTTLAACSSNPIPKVKLEKRQPRTVVQSVDYVPTRTKTLPAEAALVCENANMRAKAVDTDNTNDTARVMVVQDSDRSSQLLAETVVNCRDYFAHQAAYPTQSNIIQARTQTPIEIAPETRMITRRRGLTYVVQRGDTVWDIAREHCTSVKAISRLNGLGRANKIDVGDRLELPSEACE